jgi:hypothetical protein
MPLAESLVSFSADNTRAAPLDESFVSFFC